MTKSKSHWLIVGPGALGLLYAGQLAKQGHPVSLWGRSGEIPQSRYSWEQRPGKVVQWESTPYSNAITRILVVTKSFQSHSALISLFKKTSLSPFCPLILMHNGLGAQEEAPRLSDEQPLLLASSRQGALKVSPHHIKHTGQGITQIGLYQGELKQEEQLQLQQELQAATEQCHWHQHILEPMWQKLVINSVINPLTALHQVPNGQLLAAEFSETLSSLCFTACQIAQHEGLQLESTAMLSQVKDVIQATASNRSSMLEDVCKQRPTEIDYINGYLVKKALRHGINAANHQKLVDQIHQINSLS